MIGSSLIFNTITMNQQERDREALQANYKLLNQQQFNAVEQLERLRSQQAENKFELFMNPLGDEKHHSQLNVDQFLQEMFPTIVEEKKRLLNSKTNNFL